MNNLRAGVVLSSILAANCAATAKYEKEPVEAPVPNISVELCNEVGKVILEPRVNGIDRTVTMIVGGKYDGTRPVNVVHGKSFGGVDELDCEYLVADSATIDDILNVSSTTTARKQLTTLVITENSGSEKIPGVELLQEPPYQFVDFHGPHGEPDGIADNICDKGSCSPVRFLSPDVQKLVQARYEAVVAYTLRQLSGSVTCGMTGGRCR